MFFYFFFYFLSRTFPFPFHESFVSGARRADTTHEKMERERWPEGCWLVSHKRFMNPLIAAHKPSAKHHPSGNYKIKEIPERQRRDHGEDNRMTKPTIIQGMTRDRQPKAHQTHVCLESLECGFVKTCGSIFSNLRFARACLLFCNLIVVSFAKRSHVINFCVSLSFCPKDWTGKRKETKVKGRHASIDRP